MKKLLVLATIAALILTSMLFVTSCNGGDEVASDVLLQTIAAGDDFTLIISDGYVYVSGNNNNGQLGLGNNERMFNLERVSDINNIISVAAGYSHALALTADGAVYSWGRNSRGQLGIGSQEAQNAPQRVYGLDSGVAAVAAGGNISFALLDDGTVRSWGMNDDGHLGNGEGETGLNSYTPVKVLNLTNIVQVAAGHDHGVALDYDGNVFVWGYNEVGQMGNDDDEDVLIPIKVEGLPGGAVSIAANRLNTIVALDNGEVWATGGGIDPDEGLYFNWDATQIETFEFVHLSSFSNIVKVSSNGMSILALDDEGRVWGVGANEQGNLGLGDNDSRAAAYMVEDFDDVVEITGGSHHTLIRLENGSVYGMGVTNFGQLAQGPENRQRAISPILIKE